MLNVFSKESVREIKGNLVINLEEFSAIKGISALGNQLTNDKVSQINLLESIAYQDLKEVLSRSSENGNSDPSKGKR